MFSRRVRAIVGTFVAGELANAEGAEEMHAEKNAEVQSRKGPKEPLEFLFDSCLQYFHSSRPMQKAAKPGQAVGRMRS